MQVYIYSTYIVHFLFATIICIGCVGIVVGKTRILNVSGEALARLSVRPDFVTRAESKEPLVNIYDLLAVVILSIVHHSSVLYCCVLNYFRYLLNFLYALVLSLNGALTGRHEVLQPPQDAQLQSLTGRGAGGRGRFGAVEPFLKRARQ